MTESQKALQEAIDRNPQAVLLATIDEAGGVSYSWRGTLLQLTYLKEIIGVTIHQAILKEMDPPAPAPKLVSVTPQS